MLEREGRQRARRESRAQNAKRLVLIVALLAAWQLASGRLIHPFFVSSPSAVCSRLAEWAANGDLFPHLGVTALEMVVGFAGGTVLGLVLGIIFGLFPMLERILSPLLVGFNAVPKIALAPIFVILLGIGLMSKIVLVISVVMFLVMFNTITGIQRADKELLQALRLMHASRSQVIWHVVIPGAIAYMFVGMKLSLRYALNYAVVGEILAGNRGIGFLMSRSLGNLDTSGVMAGVVVLVVCGLSLYMGVSMLESKLLRWRLA